MILTLKLDLDSISMYHHAKYLGIIMWFKLRMDT